MVRITVGAGAALSTPLEVVATVVVVTVCVVVDVDGAWVCADASAAVAEKTTARHNFFTMFLDLGEIEISNLLYGAG
jgi:hypothetical protein